MTARNRPLFIALAVLGVAWALALAGFGIARHLKVTPEKVRAYLHTVDFNHLTGPERAAALRKLAAMLNALSLEERREVRRDGRMAEWFAAMSDDEKGGFMEATMPTGFRQMMTAFEQMPAEKRRKAVEDPVRRMREEREAGAGRAGGTGHGRHEPPARAVARTAREGGASWACGPFTTAVPRR
jgi:hypothetical protein